MAEFSGEFYAAIAGAIFGSVSGGIISLGLQWREHKEARAARERDSVDAKKEWERALAQELFFKLLSAFDDLYKFFEHIEESKRKAAELGIDLWRGMSPIPNLPESITITPAELRFLFELRDFGLWHRVGDVSRNHRGVLRSFEVFGSLRDELRKEMPARIVGTVGSSTLTTADMERLGPTFAAAHTLADSLAETVEGYMRDAANALYDYNDAIKPVLDGQSFKFELPEIVRKKQGRTEGNLD